MTFSCPGWDVCWDWIYSPTGHTDTGDYPWNNPGYTYDEDCDTEGWVNMPAWPPQPYNSAYMVWHFDSVDAEGIRVKGSVDRAFGPFLNARIRAEVDGAWVELERTYCEWFNPGQLWEFERGTLTKFEIYVIHTCGAIATMHIFEIIAGLQTIVRKRIFDPESNPVSNITVSLYDCADDSLVDTVVTNGAGVAKFCPDIGNYRISIDKSSIPDRYYLATADEDCHGVIYGSKIDIYNYLACRGSRTYFFLA